MTTVVILLLGLGYVLIASALESNPDGSDVSIVQTVQNIWNDTPSGGSGSSTTSATAPTSPTALPNFVPNNPAGGPTGGIKAM